ncbi:hypothetical protein M1403_02450 [Patescibacteria group bacterium]|nr:hypothetical protein [Patescibacteria group bacterium]
MPSISGEILSGLGASVPQTEEDVFNALAAKTPDWMSYIGVATPPDIPAKNMPSMITAAGFPPRDTGLTGEKIFSAEAVGNNLRDISNWVLMIYGSVYENRGKLTEGIGTRVSQELEKRAQLARTGVRPWTLSEQDYLDILGLARGLHKLHNLDNAFLQSNGNAGEFIKAVTAGSEDKDWFKEDELAQIIYFSRGVQQSFRFLDTNAKQWQEEAFAAMIANGGAPDDRFEIEARWLATSKAMFAGRPARTAWVNSWDTIIPEYQFAMTLQLAQILGYVGYWNRINTRTGHWDENTIEFGAWTTNDPVANIMYPHRYALYVRGEMITEAMMPALRRYSEAFDLPSYAKKEIDSRSAVPVSRPAGAPPALWSLVDAGARDEEMRDNEGRKIGLKSYFKALERGQAATEGFIAALGDFGKVGAALKSVDNYARVTLQYTGRLKENAKRSTLGGIVLLESTMAEYMRPAGKLLKPGDSRAFFQEIRNMYGIEIPKNIRGDVISYFAQNAAKGWGSRALQDVLGVAGTITGIKFGGGKR